MKTSIKLIKLSSIMLAAMLGVSSAANAALIKVTVSNNSPVNGLTLTPLYAAFHDASFDAFDAGAAASAGIEALAEVGIPGILAGERTAVDPDSVGGVLTAPAGFAGAPLIEPGEVTSAEFEVDPNLHPFFTFLSMILPSNDTFIGRDDALRIFDDAGNFLGTQVINLTGNDIWDAGTELNEVLASPFIPSGNGGAGTEENGVIGAGQSLQDFAGTLLPNGQTLDASLIDFLSAPSDFDLATITIEQVVNEVSAPNMFGLMLLGGLGLFAARRRQVKL